MKQIEINSNDAGRRLDKFMRRYLPKATLSTIYKIIRKDVKVNGKREGNNYMLAEEMFLRYISAMDLLKSGVPQLGMIIDLRCDAISKSYTKMRIS